MKVDSALSHRPTICNHENYLPIAAIDQESKLAAAREKAERFEGDAPDHTNAYVQQASNEQSGDTPVRPA